MLYSKEPTPDEWALVHKKEEIKKLALTAVKKKIITKQDFNRMLHKFPLMKPEKAEEIYKWYKSKGL